MVRLQVASRANLLELVLTGREAAALSQVAAALHGERGSSAAGASGAASAGAAPLALSRVTGGSPARIDGSLNTSAALDGTGRLVTRRRHRRLRR